MTAQIIHFHSSDPRSCHKKYPMRRFTMDPNEVTCHVCKDQDTFVLSDAGATYVNKIESRG